MQIKYLLLLLLLLKIFQGKLLINKWSQDICLFRYVLKFIYGVLYIIEIKVN